MSDARGGRAGADGLARITGRDGAELAYREVGEGRPLVLLHGFTASGRQWLDHGPAAALAGRGFRVIVPDLRGHGDSARPHDPACYPPDVLADDGLALVERLGLDDYDLGGYSLGGRVALRMLVRGARPARAVVAGQGLAAVASTAGGGLYRRVLTALVDGDRIEPGSPDAQAAYWIGQLGGDPRALLLVQDSLVATTGEELGQVQVPTLVVVGDQDHGHASAQELAAVLPRGRFGQVPGDHWTALTAPELAAAIVAFLTRDLGRDPRVVLNSVITSPSPPAEIKVRGTARLVTGPDRRQRYAAAVREHLGWQPVVGQFNLFIIEVADVTYIGSEPGTGAQHVARWPPGEEYVRPQVTPTSLGAPQSVSRLLSPGE